MIQISLSSATDFPRGMKDALQRKYKFEIPHIGQMLDALDVFAKGKNVAVLPNQTPHSNAVDYAKKNKLELCVGLLVSGSVKDPTIQVHSFCLDKDKVHEPTKGIKWSSNLFYCGLKVSPELYDNQKYLAKFNRADTFNQSIVTI